MHHHHYINSWSDAIKFGTISTENKIQQKYATVSTGKLRAWYQVYTFQIIKMRYKLGKRYQITPKSRNPQTPKRE